MKTLPTQDSGGRCLTYKCEVEWEANLKTKQKTKQQQSSSHVEMFRDYVSTGKNRRSASTVHCVQVVLDTVHVTASPDRS